jgi:hypothetical protein
MTLCEKVIEWFYGSEQEHLAMVVVMVSVIAGVTTA